MVRKTHRRSTHRSKSHKRRHSRKHSKRHTRKRGGACPCSAGMPQFGGRGGMGGADLGHAYTTSASQELYQMTGRTPGLSSGGAKKRTLSNRQAGKAAKLAAQAMRFSKEAEILNNKANVLENKAEKLENAAANIRATRGLMRVNAPEYVPSKNHLNRLETNRGMRNQEKYLTKVMRNENEELNNEFENLMRKFHQSR